VHDRSKVPRSEDECLHTGTVRATRTNRDSEIFRGRLRIVTVNSKFCDELDMRAFKKIFRVLEVLLRGPSLVGESVVSSDVIQELNVTDAQDVFIKEALGLS
jgi:hypothetical protein